MNYKEEMEIDLLDLLHQLLLKWRSILVFAIIGMIVLGIYGYYRKIPMVLDGQGELVAPVDDTSLASLGSKLTSFEKREAVLAVETYLGYEKNYEDRLSLIEKSITLNYDAFHIPSYTVYYKISDYSSDNVPPQSTVTNADNIMQLYRNAISDSSVMNKIKEANNWEYDESFVRHIYALGKSGLDIMYITIHAPTKEEARRTMDVMKKVINDASSYVQRQYEHKLDEMQTVFSEYYDQSLLDQQKTQNDVLIGIEKYMQTVGSAMTADQKAYYTALLKAVKEESTAGGESADPMTIARREAQDEDVHSVEGADKTSASSTADKATEEEQNVIMVRAKAVSIKYIFLGFGVGAFTACCFYVLLYVLSSRLRIGTDLKDVFRIPVIGYIKDNNKYTKVFSFVDRTIDSLFERNQGKISNSERMEIMTSSICIEAENSGVNKLYITGAGGDEEVSKVRSILAEEIEKSALNKYGLKVSEGISPLLSIDSLRSLSSSDSVLLVEKTGTSRYEDISRLIEVCNKFCVKIIGSVVVS